MGERTTPRLSAEQVIRVLRRHGFRLVSSSGSHQKWRNSSTERQVIVPYHGGRILPLGTMRAIMDGSLIPSEEWM